LISLNLEHDSTQYVKLGIPLPQQGQQDGQSEETTLLLMRVLTSNLNPHLIRPLQKKNPKEKGRIFGDK